MSAGDIIRVDFRYSQESWHRGAWGAGARGRLGPLAMDFLHFEERDDPEDPLAFALDDERRAVLDAAGDDPALAITSGVSHQPGKGNYILTHENTDDPEMDTYAWVDSLGDYVLRFRELGPGGGDYQTVGISAAGERIFAYKGEEEGSFVLGELLQSPEGYRLESLRLDWAGGGMTAEAELALSDWDVNLLSGKDDGDNAGLALLGRVDALLGALAGREFSLSLAAERRDEEFHFPGRRLGAQHYRAWNLPWDPGPLDEELLRGRLAWGQPGATGAALDVESLRLGERFDGLRGGLELGGEMRGVSLRGGFQATSTSDSLYGDGQRERLRLDLGVPLPLLRGLGLERERASLSEPDTLDSQRPAERRGNFLREGATCHLGGRGRGRPWSLDWGEMRISSGEDRVRQRRIQASLSSGLPGAGRFHLTGNYQRRLDFPVGEEEQAESSEQFQAETGLTWLARPGGWGGEGVYRLGSRRQRLRQSRLIHVGEGQGDLNEDGVFLGEGEGDYRRLILLADEALRTNNLELEAGLKHEEAREGSILRRLGSDTRFSLHEETRSDDLWGLARLRPDLFQRRGETLLAYIELRQELRYRLPRGGLGLRYRFRHRDCLDERDASGALDEVEGEQRLRLRHTGASGSAKLVLSRAGRRRRSEEGLGGGSYDVQEWGSELSWTRHLASRLSATLRGGLLRKRDRSRDLILHELKLEPTLSMSPFSSLRLDAAWEFKHSEYSRGNPDQGRPWFFDAPGWEKTLRLGATAQAGGNLTLSASYELRDEAERPRRHRLRMESRAYF